ncbi:MAG: C1 family peptidase [Bacteriovoracaceae bacterium]
MNILLLLPLLSISQAKTLEPKANAGNYAKHPVFLAITSVLKPYGNFETKIVEEEKVVQKALSPSEKMIEEIKAKNRAALAKRDQESKLNEKLSGPELWKKQVDQAQASWAKEISETRAQWQKEQDVFLGRIKIYKESTFKIPVKEEKIIEKKVIERDIPDSFLVEGALDVPVRDQDQRPTCASFAGIKSLEILLAQNGETKDLSEQYLYWASKPDCQNSPCTTKGSWVTPGFNYSKNQLMPDIPLESACLYQKDWQTSNETQVPLNERCKNGEVKVESFEFARTLADVLMNVKKGMPVIMAATLTENFYKNQGLVTLEDSTKNLGVGLDSHATGHAFTAVGVIELPEKLRIIEGGYCLVVANSWGVGWGAGGFSCLTEKWLLKYRLNSPFVAVTKISIK